MGFGILSHAPTLRHFRAAAQETRFPYLTPKRSSVSPQLWQGAPGALPGNCLFASRAATRASSAAIRFGVSVKVFQIGAFSRIFKMSDTESKPDTPVLSSMNSEIIERFEGRVSSIEIVRTNGPLEVRTIIHLGSKAGVKDA